MRLVLALSVAIALATASYAGWFPLVQGITQEGEPGSGPLLDFSDPDNSQFLGQVV